MYRYICLLLFPTIRLCMENFSTTKFCSYAARTLPITLALLGMLQHPCFKPVPNFLNYKNSRNTEEHRFVHTSQVLFIIL